MNIEQTYECNTLPEILGELRQVNRQRNGERVYDLFVPSKDPDGPCEVLPQSLGDIADRIERAASKMDEKHCQKPPLGLVPRSIRDRERCQEILEAIGRYNEAGKPVPSEWLEELSKKLTKSVERSSKETDPEAVRKALEHVRAWLGGMLACIHLRSQEIVYVPADSAFYLLDEIDKALMEGE